MKKLYILLASALLFLSAPSAKAQDTLLYQNFQAATLGFDTLNFPPGITTDAAWHDYDMNGGLASGTTYRPKQWFQTLTVSAFDSLLADGVTQNVVMASNSWFTPAAAAYDLLITPSVLLGPHDTLFWKSAPRQTPRYLDGYQVLLSNSNNDPASFTNVLFTAAEMTGTPANNDVNFATHTFSSGFVHGQDMTYIDPTPSTGPTAAYKGRLRPFSVPLNAYAGQTVFIAFNHNSFDDNLITIDDIMIRSKTPASTVGIQSNETQEASLKVYPNPAKEVANIYFTVTAETEAVMSVYDLAGKLVYSENKGTMAAGTHFATVNTAVLAKGFYTVTLQTNNGRTTAKLIVE